MVYRKIIELKKLSRNPRTITKSDFEKLCVSIEKYPKLFEARPITLSNRTGELIIIGGNQRYEASKVLGLKEVPTYLIEGLTESEEKEITIRDNISNGKFDWDMIANEWDNLPLDGWGLDVPKMPSEPTTSSGPGSGEGEKEKCPECGQEIKDKQ